MDMDSIQFSHKSRKRSRDPLEKSIDKWFQTGRQFVDGVAGNRPGKRKKDPFNRSSLDNVGRWVGAKIDWFFEDEDDWVQPLELEKEVKETFQNKKRALSAISLRVPKAISSAPLNDQSIPLEGEWPEESAFRIDRWERSENKSLNDFKPLSNTARQFRGQNRRPLPKSNRRRT